MDWTLDEQAGRYYYHEDDLNETVYDDGRRFEYVFLLSY